MPPLKRVRVYAQTPQKFNYGELFVKGEAIASDLSIEYWRTRFLVYFANTSGDQVALGDAMRLSTPPYENEVFFPALTHRYRQTPHRDST
jgi:hypothetical protein